MPYVSQAQLVDRFGESELIQLTDRADPPAGTIDPDVLDRAIADADAEIDSYLGARYTVPVSPVPAILEAAAADITRYRLYDERATEQIEKRYKSAVAWLRDIAAGKASLPGTTGIVAPSGGLPDYDAPERIFTADTLSGY